MWYLVFRLEGGMASWGDIAPGETRPTSSVPSRSALLGLMGAALGVRRTDYGQRRSLSQAIGFAVRLDRPGSFVSDYHTTQVPPARSRQADPRSRREALSRDALNTILSRRDYHCTVGYSVVVWGEESRLSALREALLRPHFVLYLGRKSCPLSAPVRPELVSTQTVVDALQRYDAAVGTASPGARLYWESPPEGVRVGVDVESETERRDEPVMIPGWQFRSRRELMGRMGGV